jgi:hypothetical protein
MLICLAALLSTNAYAGYWTSCVIEGGKARGYVHTDESMSFSGRVEFQMFDRDGDLVDSDWEIAVVIVVGADTEFVEEVDAPAEASRCALDISEAVGSDPDDPNGPGDDRYTTSCVVEDGKAKGYVHTRGSMSFSGRVYFKVYDATWRLVEEDWEIAVVIVVGEDTEFVEETDAPAGSAYCSLDISEAVGG